MVRRDDRIALRHRAGRRRRCRTTGRRTSAARRGRSTRSAASTTSTCSRPSSPTSTGTTRRCATDFEEILRFWLDRGVDGFRIDVAHGLVKDATLADEPEPFPVTRFASDWRTAIDQPEVHDVYRDWRRIADAYDGDRVLVGEVVFSDPARVAPYLRPDELQLAFNFSLVFQPWDADGDPRRSIDASLAALPIVTWVLENHDVDAHRHALRRARGARGGAAPARAARARCSSTRARSSASRRSTCRTRLRQDPVFQRTGGERKGRDGCRVPMPWERAQLAGAIVAAACRRRGRAVGRGAAATTRARCSRSTGARSSCGRGGALRVAREPAGHARVRARRAASAP